MTLELSKILKTLSMKILVIETADRYNKTAKGTLELHGADNYQLLQNCPRLWFKADSALLKNKKPFFVPDFTNECSASPYLAVRVSRMGKSIPARFAHRYYDGMCVAVDFTAEDVLRQLQAQGEPWDLAKSFDGSVAIGDFVDLPADGLHAPQCVEMSINGEVKSRTVIENLAEFVDSAIERASLIFTIRQGDILLIGSPDSKPLVKIDDHIVCSLNGEVVTEFNVK